MRLPTYEEIALDEKQNEVLETPLGESLFVVGPPASGKTVLAVHRAQMLAKEGITVVLVTYSRMLRRLIDQLTGERVSAQTMHEFVGSHYFAQTNAEAPSTAPFVFNWHAMFTTLEHRGVTPKPLHVVVDEGQDLPSEFFRYLRNFVATTITVFADEDQALADKRSTSRDIEQAARLDDPVLLCANYRNTPEIARVAGYYHAGHAPVPKVIRLRSGERPQVVLYRGDEAAGQIANWYTARGGRVGVAVVDNETGEALHARLRNQLAGQRVDFYTNRKKNEDAIDLLRPGISVLNVQSMKGQEFDTVFVMEFDELFRETTDVGKHKMYMLCARARDNLFLMHEGERLPPAILEELPGVDILERP